MNKITDVLMVALLMLSIWGLLLILVYFVPSLGMYSLATGLIHWPATVIMCGIVPVMIIIAHSIATLTGE